MTREINGRIRMVVSDDGTRCAAECPAYDGPYEADDKCWKEAPAGATGICTDPRFYGEHVDDDSHPYIFDGLRCGACIAAEQAAASVPSCEGIADDIERLERHIRKNGDRLGDDIVESIERIISVVVTSPPVDAPHLDGGARALDASEALREARVQGMREALSIAKSNAYATVYDTVDWSHVDEVFRAAIEAVRKGER